MTLYYYGIDKDGEHFEGEVSNGVGPYVEAILDTHTEAGDQAFRLIEGNIVGAVFSGQDGTQYRYHPNGRVTKKDS
jgi:hypothetical protein